MVGESDALKCRTVRAASSLLCYDGVQRAADLMNRSSGVKLEPVAINQRTKFVQRAVRRGGLLVSGEWQNDPGRR